MKKTKKIRKTVVRLISYFYEDAEKFILDRAGVVAIVSAIVFGFVFFCALYDGRDIENYSWIYYLLIPIFLGSYMHSYNEFYKKGYINCMLTDIYDFDLSLILKRRYMLLIAVSSTGTAWILDKYVTLDVLFIWLFKAAFVSAALSILGTLFYKLFKGLKSLWETFHEVYKATTDETEKNV